MNLIKRLIFIILAVSLTGCAVTAYKSQRVKEFSVAEPSLLALGSDITIEWHAIQSMPPIPLLQFGSVLHEHTQKMGWYKPDGYMSVVEDRIKKNFLANGVNVEFKNFSDPAKYPFPPVTSVVKPTFRIQPIKLSIVYRGAIASSYYIYYRMDLYAPGNPKKIATFTEKLSSPSVFEREYLVDHFVIPWLNKLGDLGAIKLSAENAKQAQ